MHSARLPDVLEALVDRRGRSEALASAPWRIRRQLARLRSRPRARGESFRFAVLGDAEPGRFWIFRKLFNEPGVFERQLKDVQRRGVDFSVQLGDMVSRGVPRNYLRFFRDLGRWGVRVPYLPVIGNRDRRWPRGGSDSELYRTYFGMTDYAFDHGGVRFVVLDTSRERLTRCQLAWLGQVLDTRRRKFVFTHFPPASLRRWTGLGRLRRIVGFREGADDFVRLMSERRVGRVYLGHIHAFGVQDFRGARYVLTGGGGSPLFPSWIEDRFRHYLVVTVGPDGVSENVHCADGRALTIPPGKVLLSS